jgi:3',5'-cyclic AMP phosphodiesterase CpdA
VSQTDRADYGPIESNGRAIVAIGDLHGDLSQTLAVLRLVHLIDEQGSWTGEDTILVQTGDVFDRGPDSRAIYETLRELQGQARQRGGDVVLLLGNHEVMNLIGDLRYVHPGDIAQFGGTKARSQALSPSGDWGRWLSTLPIVAQVDRTVFAHGGITEEWARLGIERINARAADALRMPPEQARSQDILGTSGPLWYRGFAQDPEDLACAQLSRALDALDADRMVVGHTTRRDGRILSRCDGALWVIDIGIAQSYGGNLGALRIDGTEVLPLAPPAPLPF